MNYRCRLGSLGRHHPLLRGVAPPGGRQARATLGRQDLLFLVFAVVLFIFTLLFLPFFLSVFV